MVRPEGKPILWNIMLFLVEGSFKVELAKNVLSKVDVTNPTNYILLLKLRVRGHPQTNSIENKNLLAIKIV